MDDKRPSSSGNDSRHAARTSAMAILTELIKLRAQQKYLDANQIALDPQKSNSQAEMSQINDVENLKTELDINFGSFVDGLRRDTGHALAQLRAFQRAMANATTIQQCPMKEYRAHILLVDRLLHDSAERNAAQVLRLRHEFTAMEAELAQRLGDDSNLLRQHARLPVGRWHALAVRHAVSAPIERADSDEVRQFDRFVADSAGHSGGWGDEEHRVFVKVRAKFRNNVERICRELQLLLTGACGG